MKHKKDAIEMAERVQSMHRTILKSEIEVHHASCVTLRFALETGLYPGYESEVKRALNYLKSSEDTIKSGVI